MLPHWPPISDARWTRLAGSSTRATVLGLGLLLLGGLLGPQTTQAASCEITGLFVDKITPMKASSAYAIRFRVVFAEPQCTSISIPFGSENFVIPPPSFRNQPVEFEPEDGRFMYHSFMFDFSAHGDDSFAWHVTGSDGTEYSAEVTRSALPSEGTPLMSLEKSSGEPVLTVTDTQLRARVPSGVRFYTEAMGDLGVALSPSGVSWTTASDSTKKEAFREANGEHVLDEIRRMRLGSWSYKAQADSIRHYGPLAQDFFDAFGHDGLGTVGTDTTIASADADGVLFIAAQALAKRTATLRKETKALRRRVDSIEGLRERLATLESRALGPAAPPLSSALSGLGGTAAFGLPLLIGLLLGGLLSAVFLQETRS